MAKAKTLEKAVVLSNLKCSCMDPVKNIAEFMEIVRVLYAHDDVANRPVYICTLKCKKCGREIDIG